MDLPEGHPRLTDAFLTAHRASAEVLRGAGVTHGLSLVGQEWIVEDGGDDEMVAHRAAMEDQFLEVAADGDFVGAQSYSCARIGPDGPVAGDPDLMTLAHMEYRPRALGASVRRFSEVLPGTPIVVTENGLDTADDAQRIAFTGEARESLAAAITDGADVRGYVHWSLLDDVEWFAGYGPTFGLVEVDRQTFVRTPEPSLAWLGAAAGVNAI